MTLPSAQRKKIPFLVEGQEVVFKLTENHIKGTHLVHPSVHYYTFGKWYRGKVVEIYPNTGEHCVVIKPAPKASYSFAGELILDLTQTPTMFNGMVIPYNGAKKK